MLKVAGKWSLQCALVALGVSVIVNLGSTARADDRDPGAIAGVDLGVSEPTSLHFSHRAGIGAAAIPYVGYMFDDYLGLEFNLPFNFQTANPNVHGAALAGPLPPNTYSSGAATSMVGYLFGPRLEIPFESVGVPLHIYGLAQGGGFTGLSGTVTQTAPGMSFGGGLNYYVTDDLALTLFGNWNRMLSNARPYPFFNTPWAADDLANPNRNGPVDFAQFGIGVKFDFREKAAPPPPPAPPPVKQAQAAPPPPMKKKIVLRGVNFDFNKYNIRPVDVPILEEAARTLKAENYPTVIDTGYTDSIGSDKYNDKLSMERADSVRTWLVQHGVPANKIVAEGMGKRDPVATNDTADGRAQNRRVELKVRE